MNDVILTFVSTLFIFLSFFFLCVLVGELCGVASPSTQEVMSFMVLVRFNSNKKKAEVSVFLFFYVLMP